MEPYAFHSLQRQRTAQGSQRIVKWDPTPGAKHLFATKLGLNNNCYLRFCRRHSTLVWWPQLPPKGNLMAAERFYIYRCGRTDSCAVTAIKNEARLLRSLCPTSWQFWMQITRYQFEDSRSGFTFDEIGRASCRESVVGSGVAR